MSELWPWLAVFGLGMFHGINPAMGWLFAVALGLQEQKRAAVFRALPPIALGHALSIGIIIAVVLLARVTVPYRTLKIGAAAILFAFGLYRLLRSRHPNWVGMRVGFGDLTLWSFVMASAHGAGLMLVPFFLQSPAAGESHHHDTHQMHAWAFANFSAPSLLSHGGRSPHLGVSSNDRAGRDGCLRKTWGRDTAPRVVQHRFRLDARADDHRRLHPALLICGRCTRLNFVIRKYKPSDNVILSEAKNLGLVLDQFAQQK